MDFAAEGKIADLIQHITEISIETGNIEQVLEIFSEFINVAVAFIDSDKKITIINDAPGVFKENIRLYPTEEIQRIYYNYNVTVSSTCIGSLILDLPLRTNFHLIDLLPHISNSIKICSMTERGNTFFSESDDTLLSSLFKGKTEDMLAGKRWIQKKRINAAGKFIVVSIFFKEKEINEISDETVLIKRELLYQRYCGISRCSSLPFLSMRERNMAFFLFSVSENSSLKPLLNNFREISSHNFAEPSNCVLMSFIGSGNEVIGYEEISSSWKNSINAIRHTIISNNNNIASEWTEIGTERIPASLANDNQHLTYCKKVLFPLLTYDNFHHGSLFRTLIVFALNHWNLTLSAKKMFLHYNSVKYRYNNISDILQIDLDEPQNRFNLALIVRIYLYSLEVDILSDLISQC